MKKISFVLILAFASTIGVAQNEYKLGKGDVTTELQLSLFNFDYYNETSTGPLSMSGFRLRYAFSEKLALRLNVGLDFGHRTSERDLADTLWNYYPEMYANQITSGLRTSKSNYTDFSIAPGIEYHFGKWERMSVYVGGEVYFRMFTTRSTLDINQIVEDYRYIDNTHILDYVTETISTLKAKNTNRNGDYQDGMMFFGINLVTGMDFYVYKGLYLGAELNIGYGYGVALKGSLKGEEIITVTYPAGSEVKNNIDKKLEDKVHNGNLAFKCNPMIRIGWKF